MKIDADLRSINFVAKEVIFCTFFVCFQKILILNEPLYISITNFVNGKSIWLDKVQRSETKESLKAIWRNLEITTLSLS